MKTRIMKAFIEEAKKNSIKFTMNDLAENLGMSKKTIYKYFSSKGEILDTIISNSFDDIKVRESEITSRADLSTVEKIKKVIMIVPNYFDLYDKEILNQMKNYYPDQWEKVTYELNKTWENLEQLLKQGVKEGVIKNINLTIVLNLLSNGVHWMKNKNFLLENGISLEEAYSTIAEVILFGLLVVEEK